MERGQADGHLGGRAPASEDRPVQEGKASRRAGDLVVTLKGHSYQAGLWMQTRWPCTSTRKGYDEDRPLSTIELGERWSALDRTHHESHFPAATQIVDWSHAEGKLWTVGKAVFGEQSAQGRVWVEDQLDRLWCGAAQQVAAALRRLALDQERLPDEVRQAPGYFEGNRQRMRYDQFRAQGYPIAVAPWKAGSTPWSTIG